MNSFIVTSTIGEDPVYVRFNSIMDLFEWTENIEDAYEFTNNEDYDKLMESGILKDNNLSTKPKIEKM